MSNRALLMSITAYVLWRNKNKTFIWVYLLSGTLWERWRKSEKHWLAVEKPLWTRVSTSILSFCPNSRLWQKFYYRFLNSVHGTMVHLIFCKRRKSIFCAKLHEFTFKCGVSRKNQWIKIMRIVTWEMIVMPYAQRGPQIRLRICAVWSGALAALTES